MKPRYVGLQQVAVVIKVFGVLLALVGGGGVFLTLKGVENIGAWDLLKAAPFFEMLASGVVALAFAGAITCFIDIEGNTRKTNELLAGLLDTLKSGQRAANLKQDSAPVNRE